MPIVATWIRAKDEKYFVPFFRNAQDIQLRNAARSDPMDWSALDGLLLTGGADIVPEFLRQPVPDPSVLDSESDIARDRWEFDALERALALRLPVFGVCKGMQVLNVGLGGTLQLDLPGHNLPEQKTQDVQSLRTDRTARHRFEKVNSSHHQAIERLGEGLTVEAWCATDDVIEQVRLRDYPFALAVQYHPERGTIYGSLFDDFIAQVRARAANEHSRA